MKMIRRAAIGEPTAERNQGCPALRIATTMPDIETAEPGGTCSVRRRSAQARSSCRAPHSFPAIARHGGHASRCRWTSARSASRQRSVRVLGEQIADARQFGFIAGLLRASAGTTAAGAGADNFSIQHSSATRNARHHGSNRHVQHLRDFGIREFLDVAKPDGLAERIGQTRRAPPADPRPACSASGSAPASRSGSPPPPPAAACSTCSLSTSTASRLASRRRFLHVLWRIV